METYAARRQKELHMIQTFLSRAGMTIMLLGALVLVITSIVCARDCGLYTWLLPSALVAMTVGKIVVAISGCDLNWWWEFPGSGVSHEGAWLADTTFFLFVFVAFAYFLQLDSHPVFVVVGLAVFGYSTNRTEIIRRRRKLLFTDYLSFTIALMLISGSVWALDSAFACSWSMGFALASLWAVAPIACVIVRLRLRARNRRA